MRKNGQQTANYSEGQNKMKSDEAAIILDGQATTKAPSEPSLLERTKKALENLGTKINGI